MSYSIYHTRELNLRLFPNDTNLSILAQEPKTIEKSLADLLLEEACQVWVISRETYQKIIEKPSELHITDLLKYPLAANYQNKGSTDIRDKILVQDPFQQKGPFIFDLKRKSRSKHFKRQTLQGYGEPKIVDYHVAGDKIPDNRYYFVGNPEDLFEELKKLGYKFRK